MRRPMRFFVTALASVLLLSQPSSAFTNKEWVEVPTYEAREAYPVDNGEMLAYLTDLYYQLTPSGETREVVEAFFRRVMTPAKKTFQAQEGVTKGGLSQVLFNTVRAAYPDLTPEAADPVDFAEASALDAKTNEALQFVLTRRIAALKDDGSFGIEDRLTLGEAMEMLDKTLLAAPAFTPAAPEPEPEPAPKPEPEPKPEPVAGKAAYLTFDDSISENSVKILDILKEYDIKATFFLTGKGDPDIIRRMAEEGHVIGNHTMSHDYKTIYQSPEAFWADFEAEGDYLEEILGYRPTLMRFPGGSNNTVSKRYCTDYYIMPTLVAQAAEKGYTYVDWNVSNGDASANLVPRDTLVQNALDTAKNKDKIILLMHQTKVKTTTPEALPEIIDALLAQGYTFLPLSEDSFHYQFPLK